MAGAVSGSRPEPGGPSTRGRTDASWNPLVCEGTALPPNLLLAGKLIALFLYVREGPVWLPDVFLPFVPALDVLRAAGPLPGAILGAGFLVFTASLLLNRWPRISCFALGTIVLLSILADRTSFSNTMTFVGCYLVLLGLHDPTRPPWLLRAQVVLVYFGAGLNKLLSPAWRTGEYFEFWFGEILEGGPHEALLGIGPDAAVSAALGWLVIAVELGLAVGFALPRLYRYAIAVGVVFHVGMLVVSGGVVSWPFLYLMSVSYLAFVRWPEPGREASRDRAGRDARAVPLPRFATSPIAWIAFAAPLLAPYVHGFLGRGSALLRGIVV